MYMSHLVYSSNHSVHLCYFHLFVIVNNAAMSIGVQLILLDLAFSSLDIYPEVEMLGPGLSISTKECEVL